MVLPSVPARRRFRRPAAAASAAVAVALAATLTACGGETDGADEVDGADQAEQSQELTLEDGYVGAKDPDTAMTAVFGELTNHTDEDIHLTGVTGTLPGDYQFHEVTDGMMKQTDDGLVVPADSSVDMAPGGHHIMIMDNHDDIAAGDVLTLTLTSGDAEGDTDTFELDDIPVRVQQSGHEDYAPEDGDSADGNDSADHAGH